MPHFVLEKSQNGVNDVSHHGLRAAFSWPGKSGAKRHALIDKARLAISLRNWRDDDGSLRSVKVSIT